MRRFSVIISALLAASLSFAATTQELYDAYINQYKDIAIREMNDYGIPASITLAQGILESGIGQSRLAVEANNHFGIKCHNDWNGERMYHDDDALQECFRVYANAEESFVDHSQFLKTKARYSFLFELDRTDYQGWAKGLKQAGYATDPAYPKRLIDLIESLGLARFDTVEASQSVEEPVKSTPQVDPITDLRYVLAQKNESYYTIAVKYNIPSSRIYKFNDVDGTGRQPAEGERVYLQKKKKQCLICPSHVVAEGESMHSISQMYGIRVHNLYDLNDMPYNSVPVVGQVLKLH